MMSDRGHRWVELGELLADGLLTGTERRRIGSQEIGAVRGDRTDYHSDLSAWFTLQPNVMVAAQWAAYSAVAAVRLEERLERAEDLNSAFAEQKAQADMLRDIYGNPFRPPVVDRAWLAWQDRTAPQLGRATDEEWRPRATDEKWRPPEGTLDPARLALLADALEDAGCTDAELLGHLRSPGPHVRGCWAVDLVLGKS
jgi:hypothetical protein